MKHKLVIVKWLDSNIASGWSREVCNQPAKCVSVGWMIAKSKTAITLTANKTKSTTPQKCGDITIPRCSITSIKSL